MDLDRESAVEIFVAKLVRHAYSGTIRDAMSILEDGPTWSAPDQVFVDLHVWYEGLSDSDRHLVGVIVEQVVFSSLFSVLNVFDGTAGTLVPGFVTELLISLRVHPNTPGEMPNESATSVELNPLGATHEELHDRFQWAVADLRKEFRPHH